MTKKEETKRNRPSFPPQLDQLHKDLFDQLMKNVKKEKTVEKEKRKKT
jgi:hypothetical protein